LTLNTQPQLSNTEKIAHIRALLAQHDEQRLATLRDEVAAELSEDDYFTILDQPARKDTKRLDIAFAAAHVQAIRALASLTGESTLTAVVRDALKVYAWLVTEQQRNRRIISGDRERGDRTELMPLLTVRVP
jgi:hypothetical protein